ncbi:DUF1971 domain-containing protein [Phenylobacterium sp. 58.2.17]|uniref:DUF1971 domain-containing protein n=1 Tax=Phenylobacterium sp. 58.2.17 TaxID=2969306 RepID=UPI002263DC78|nr:DUF1971 domain-containing protein [Phenylobacterium sp. 58.2.17]MCX7585789.1 DUF1971 domain-containing protein [Phenylobacterium sp. 58.2.17]
MTKPADSFPNDVVAYRRTPEFDETTTPAGLLGEHNTKAGVWGRIQVMAGALLYRVTDPRREAAERLLTPAEAPGVVEPGIVHHVTLTGPVRFYVEFLKAPD